MEYLPVVPVNNHSCGLYSFQYSLSRVKTFWDSGTIRSFLPLPDLMVINILVESISLIFRFVISDTRSPTEKVSVRIALCLRLVISWSLFLMRFASITLGSFFSALGLLKLTLSYFLLRPNLYRGTDGVNNLILLGY